MLCRLSVNDLCLSQISQTDFYTVDGLKSPLI